MDWYLSSYQKQQASLKPQFPHLALKLPLTANILSPHTGHGLCEAPGSSSMPLSSHSKVLNFSLAIQPMDQSQVVMILDYAALAVDAVGILLLVYGAALAVAGMLRAEMGRKALFDDYESIKRSFIQKIILALDFFVAADLMRLVTLTDISGILSLALIVAIRTVLSWSLSKEMRARKEAKA